MYPSLLSRLKTAAEQDEKWANAGGRSEILSEAAEALGQPPSDSEIAAALLHTWGKISTGTISQDDARKLLDYFLSTRAKGTL